MQPLHFGGKTVGGNSYKFATVAMDHQKKERENTTNMPGLKATSYQNDYDDDDDHPFLSGAPTKSQGPIEIKVDASNPNKKGNGEPVKVVSLDAAGISEDLVRTADLNSGASMSNAATIIANSLNGRLEGIGKNISLMKKRIEKIGSKRDSPEFRTELLKLIGKTKNEWDICKELLEKFKIFTNNEGDATKQHYVKSLKEFHEMYQQFLDQINIYKQKQQVEVEQQKKSQKSDLDALKTGKKKTPVINPQDESRPADFQEDDDLLAAQKLVQTRNRIEINEIIIKEREKEIEQIEKDIYDISGMMREINAMVVEQGEQIDMIDNTVETAAAHVDKGNEELKKAEKYSKKGRWLIFLLFFLVLCCGLIFVLFVVILLKVLLF